MTEDLEHRLARSAWEFSRSSPRPLLKLATRHVIDYLGVLFAGMNTPEMSQYLGILRADGGRVGNGAPFSLDEALPSSTKAAFLGAAGHFHDFDDDDPSVSIGHPTVPVAAAMFATARPEHDSLDLLGAYLAGIELLCRIGACVNPGHYNRGSHATATLGVFGAAITSGILRGGSPEILAQTLGFAAIASSGLKSAFGSSAKPIQVGFAAAKGVEAAAIAAGGMTSSNGVVFGRSGWVDMNGSLDSADHVVGKFAAPHIFEAPGVNIKRYPCCSSSHTAIDGILEVIERGNIDPGEIENVSVWIGDDVPGILIYDRPNSGLEGKFSLKYPLAVAAVKRSEPTLEDFSDARVRDGNVGRIMDRIRVEIDPSLPRSPGGVTHCMRLRIRTASGKSDEIFVENPKGSASLPLSDAALKKKFVMCASPVLGAESADAAFEYLLKMPSGISVAGILSKLRLSGDWN